MPKCDGIVRVMDHTIELNSASIDSSVVFYELQSRSYAVLADTGRAIRSVTIHSKLSVKHYELCTGLKSLVKKMNALVDVLHTPESVVAIERMSPENLLKALEPMRKIPTQLTELVDDLRTVNLGFWKPLYERQLRPLEQRSRALEVHLQVLSTHPILLLTKSDEEQLLQAILNAPEPSLALRRSFTSK